MLIVATRMKSLSNLSSLKLSSTNLIVSFIKPTHSSRKFPREPNHAAMLPVINYEVTFPGVVLFRGVLDASLGKIEV